MKKMFIFFTILVIAASCTKSAQPPVQTSIHDTVVIHDNNIVYENLENLPGDIQEAIKNYHSQDEADYSWLNDTARKSAEFIGNFEIGGQTFDWYKIRARIYYITYTDKIYVSKDFSEYLLRDDLKKYIENEFSINQTLKGIECPACTKPGDHTEKIIGSIFP